MLSWRYRAGCLKVLALQILLLLIGLSGLSFTGIGIDYLRQQLQPNSPDPHWLFGWRPPPDWPPAAVLGLVAGCILGLALLRVVLTFLYQAQVGELVQGRIVVDLRAQVYDKLQRLSFRFFDENASGSIINRVTRDVQATRLFIDGVLLPGIIMALSLGIYLAYMLSLHTGLTLACLATTPLLWLLTARFSRLVKPAYLLNRSLVDRMILVLSETVQGIHVIKGFAREPEAMARFRKANRKVRDQNAWIFLRVTRYTPGIGFLAQLNLVVLLAYGGYLAIQGVLPLGAGLVVFAGLLQQFSGQISNLSNLANSVQESLSGARRVFDILDAPVEIRNAPDALRPPRLLGGVRFEGVSFHYEPGAEVLREVTFDVQPGQCIAILGATGSGKSTLLSLIPRFYDPTRGAVLLDGMDARRLDLDILRKNVGIVFQENFLFSNTVAANIAFGNPGATREQVERAARVAAAHDFITELPKGYDTVLAEGACTLSGGQRQRLAIARAILLEPAILLLDDPTAAIDPDTEHEILEAMANATAGRTTFVVAHRLSTLRRADLILVLERGRLVQSGTHEQLMAVTGPYRGAALLQLMDGESRRILEGAAP